MTDKLSFRVSTEVFEAEPDPDFCYPNPVLASSSNRPSPRPPPFSSLYFPPPTVAAKSYVTEPDPSTLPAFAPAPPFDNPTGTSAVEAELKAALPRDTKAESSNRASEEGEPPPPYTEGSSPLEGFTYVMAAAGGAASILTQVQQSGPVPVNSLSGTSDGSFNSIYTI